MEDFAFGSLSTLRKRVDHARQRRLGVQHNYQMTPRVPKPGQAPQITVTVSLDVNVTAVACRVLQPETAVILLTHVDTQWDVLNWRYYQVWQGTLPPQSDKTLVRYQITAHTERDVGVAADEGETFAYLVGDPTAPAWAETAVVYQIFPDRFHPGPGKSWSDADDLTAIHGGTLQGIRHKLDYLADLGVTALWINPFFPDDTHHGYHATDYFNVNPRLGTMEDLRALVDEAHGRDMRLILDFVANHFGHDHPAFQEAQQDRNSNYYHWFYWNKWPHDYKTFFGVKELPQVNTNHPAARDYLLRSAAFWVGEVGFDGLRLDYALGPSHDFWTDLRARLQAIKPDVWIFGEVVETPATLLTYDGRFHGCLDFMLMQAIRDTFAQGIMDVATFDAFLHNHESFTPRHFMLPSFLDNHDTNRFLWLAGNDKRRLKLAALCQFTLRGAPIIYNGTEVGVSQEIGIWQDESAGMAEARRPMPWGKAQDEELLDFYRWLIDFRRAHPVIWEGTRRTLHVDGERGTYVYVVADTDKKEAVLVALNLSDNMQEVTVTWQETPYTFTLPPRSGDVREWYNA